MLKRIIQGFTSLAVAQIITTVANLILIPLYISQWTVDIYGEWMALYSLITFLSLLNGGLSIAVINRLSELYVADNRQEYAKIQNSAYALYTSIFIGGTLIWTLLTREIPFYEWLGIKQIPLEEAKQIVWLLGIQALWIIPEGLVLNTYRIAGNLAVTQWITNIQSILVSVSLAIVLLAGGGPAAIAFWGLLMRISVTFIVLLDVQRRMYALRPGLANANWFSIRQILVPSWNFLLIALSGLLTQQGPVALISNRLGGGAVAVFVTTRTLTNLVRQVVGAINTAVWPEVTRLWARNELRELHILHQLSTIITTALTIVAAAILFWEGTDIILLWTDGQIHADPFLVRLLVLQLVFATPWLASSVITAATNQNRKLAYLYVISSVIGLGAIGLLIGKYGVLSVPISLILGEMLACYYFVVRDSCKIVHENYLTVAVRLYLGLSFTLIIALVAGALVYYRIQAPQLLRWLLIAFTSGITTAIIVWSVWLDQESRNAFLRLYTRLIKGFQG